MNVQTSPTTATLPKWTVLQYSAADNNLASYMLDDIKEMESVGSDSYTNLVAQVDPGETKGARYLLQKGGSPALEEMGNVDMANPQTLADFISWGMKNYPAEHYALIISDHGGGWKGACEDDSFGTWMTTPMLREGLEKAEAQTGRKLDFLGFDACLMASAEVVGELGKHADYMVASEQTEGADGWGYSKIFGPELLNTMKQAHMMKINVDPKELAVLAVKTCETNQGTLPTMTAFDTSKFDAVVGAIDKLGKAIIATETPVSTLKGFINQSTNFYGFKDLGDFANRVATSDKVTDQALKDAALEVQATMKETIIAEQHSSRYPNATGLHLEMSTYGVPSGYEDLKLAKETSWAEALQKLGK